MAKFLPYLFLFTLPFLAFGEILQVEMEFKREVCDTNCMNLLQRLLKQNPAIADVNITPGKATARWKPDEPFSYTPIRMAFHRIGVKLAYLSITLQGKIEIHGKKAYIVSLGDNTQLELISIPRASASQYIEFNSMTNRFLSPEVFAELKEAQNKDSLVTIEGEFFEIERYPNSISIKNKTIKKN